MAQSSIIAVGDELLAGFTLDTNSHWMAGRLFRNGYPARWIEVIGDSEPEIVGAVRSHIGQPAISRIFVCGGLGPTPDDRTSAALARALDRPLLYDRAVGALMQQWLFRSGAAARRGTAELNAGNRKMAFVPQGATLLGNGAGMAPGLAFEIGAGRYLFALPGIPSELKAVFERAIEPRYLQGETGRAVVELRYRMAPESAFHDAMLALAEEYPDVALGSYPQTEVRELVLRASGTDAERVQAVLAQVRARVPRYQPIED